MTQRQTNHHQTSREGSAFDVVDIQFRSIVERGFRIDGAAIDLSLPQRPMQPQELKAVLLHPSTSFDVRDIAWRYLIERARQDQDAMTVALGMLQPGMRHACGRLVRQLGVADTDVDSEFLTAVIEAIITIDLGSAKLANRLVSAGVKQVRSIYAHEFPVEAETTTTSSVGSARRTGAGINGSIPSNHPEVALWRAVDEGVITAQDAELVAATRLGGDKLQDLSTRYGITYHALRARRVRAEGRLARWAKQVAIDDAEDF